MTRLTKYPSKCRGILPKKCAYRLYKNRRGPRRPGLCDSASSSIFRSPWRGREPFKPHRTSGARQVTQLGQGAGRSTRHRSRWNRAGTDLALPSGATATSGTASRHRKCPSPHPPHKATPTPPPPCVGESQEPHDRVALYHRHAGGGGGACRPDGIVTGQSGLLQIKIIIQR